MTGDSRYILREATSEEIEQTRREHASSWAYGLTGIKLLSHPLLAFPSPFTAQYIYKSI